MAIAGHGKAACGYLCHGLPGMVRRANHAAQNGVTYPASVGFFSCQRPENGNPTGQILSGWAVPFLVFLGVLCAQAMAV